MSIIYKVPFRPVISDDCVVSVRLENGKHTASVVKLLGFRLEIILHSITKTNRHVFFDFGEHCCSNLRRHQTMLKPQRFSSVAYSSTRLWKDACLVLSPLNYSNSSYPSS